MCRFATLVFLAAFSTLASTQEKPPSPASGSVFRDCPECPEMVVLPLGSFVMGSPATEEGRRAHEGPQHSVNIGYAFAVGRFELTRGQFTVFVTESGHAVDGNCGYWDTEAERWRNDQAKNWRDPGFAQDDNHPVVCISWEDAKAYTAWVSRKTGKRYRLLSESEWEYAARAGSSTSRPWGENPDNACDHANSADAEYARVVGGRKAVHKCNDGHAYTAPVGRFKANAFGIHDMIGNVWSWVEDCYNTSYSTAPVDGSAWQAGDCSRRLARGLSWNAGISGSRSAYRYMDSTKARYNMIGVRIARTL